MPGKKAAGKAKMPRVQEKNPEMSAAEMKTLLKRIWGPKANQTRAAEFLGIWPQSIRRNVAGDSPIQGPVRAALRARAELEKLRANALGEDAVLGSHKRRKGLPA